MRWRRCHRLTNIKNNKVRSSKAANHHEQHRIYLCSSKQASKQARVDLSLPSRHAAHRGKDAESNVLSEDCWPVPCAVAFFDSCFRYISYLHRAICQLSYHNINIK
jgi:hypothetical protein